MTQAGPVPERVELLFLLNGTIYMDLGNTLVTFLFAERAGVSADLE